MKLQIIFANQGANVFNVTETEARYAERRFEEGKIIALHFSERGDFDSTIRRTVRLNPAHIVSMENLDERFTEQKA